MLIVIGRSIGKHELFDVGKYIFPDSTASTTLPKCALCWTFEAFALGMANAFVVNIKLDVFKYLDPVNITQQTSN